MKFQLTGRPKAQAFDLSPGDAFLHNGEVYLATPYARLDGGKTINAVKLTTGSFFSFDESLTVERIHGTFIEDDLSADPAEGL